MKKKITKQKNDKYIVPALYRGLSVLETVSRFPQGVSQSEIPGDIPPATLYRILNTLTETGYLVQDSGDKYRISRKMLSTGYRAMSPQNFPERILPVLRKLRDLTGETALAAALYEEEGVVLEQVESDHAVKVTVRIGHHFPLHSAAPGKVLLAFLPDAELDRLLDRMVFSRFTDATISDRISFEKELEKVKKCGFAFDMGEEIEDIRCVAAPVFDFRNNLEGAVWVSGPASRMSIRKMKRFADIVRHCAEYNNERNAR